MSGKISRRQAVIGLSSTLLLPAACSRPEPESGPVEIFAHGVASGDPDRTSVVIWTRVSGIDAPADVGWEVAGDGDFQDVVASGRFITDRDRDHTVKVVVDNLAPGVLKVRRHSSRRRQQ